MINHARTLLLNVNGASRPLPTFFLEEYIDPKYGTLILPMYLNQAKAPLFGSDADDAYKNYIMRTCMSVLHSTEFVSYVYAMDPRVTYLDRPSVADSRTSLVAAPANDLAKTGEAEIIGISSDAAQRVQWNWDIEVLSGGPTMFVVQVSRRQPYAKQLFMINFSDGYSDLIPLPGQNQMYFRFKTNIAVGMLWTATAFILPTVSLDTMMQACGKNGDAAGQLFGNTEPYKTFGDLWKKHVYLNYKLSGYLLAVAYRMEEVRVNATR